MVGLRDAREALLLAYDSDYIHCEDFILLYGIRQSKNDYPYWEYERFDLEKMDDSETWSEFRFYKNDIYRLKDALRLPEYFSTYNRLKVSGIEGLCILLKRFAYPCRYYEFVNRLGRPVPDYSIIFNDVMTRIYDRFEFPLSDFNVPFLSQNHLMEYCRVIKNKGVPLDRCIGFIDGTVRPICRPGRNQAIVYNGHKRVHALKYQSVALPNGLIGNMFGPLEGKRHDCALFKRVWSYSKS